MIVRVCFVGIMLMKVDSFVFRLCMVDQVVCDCWVICCVVLRGLFLMMLVLLNICVMFGLGVLLMVVVKVLIEVSVWLSSVCMFQWLYGVGEEQLLVFIDEISVIRCCLVLMRFEQRFMIVFFMVNLGFFMLRGGCCGYCGICCLG